MTSVLLINEPPLQVLPSLAIIIGLNEALVLQQVHYWIQPSRNRNTFDNRCWVYNTYEQWREQFPFWSKSTISRTILNLESMGVLLSRESGGRFKYYTIDYESLQRIHEHKDASSQNASIQNDPTIDSNCPDASIQNESMIDSNCIDTYIDTETTTETTSKREGVPSSISPPPLAGVRDLPFGESPLSLKASPSVSKKKVKLGTRLADDWVLPIEWREWCLESGMFSESIERTALQFKNYWLSTTSNDTKKDWRRTWQNWCMRDSNNRHLSFKESYGVSPSSNTDSTTPNHSPTVRRDNRQAEMVIKQSSNPKIQRWHELQPELERRVGEANYKSWLADLELVSFDEKALFKAPNAFKADQVYNRFIDDIAAILAKIDSTLGIEINIKSQV